MALKGAGIWYTSGVALVESPNNPSRVPGGNAVYMGSDAGRWGDVVMGHVEDLSGCLYFLGEIANKRMMTSEQVVEDCGERRRAERVVEEWAGHQMIPRKHYWSTGGYKDEEFRMRSSSMVVCFAPAH